MTPASDVTAEAVRGWSGAELEDALALAGAVGYAVRSQSQWQVHPQGRVVSGLPLLSSAEGPGPGRSAGAGSGASCVRVLDLTRVIAGPVATRTLAAWGADVLRLDSPHLPEMAAQALDTLTGKRSALLDFCEPTGQARLEKLLSEADVLVQGWFVAWRTHHEHAARVAGAMASRTDLTAVRLTSQREVERWLAGPLPDILRPQTHTGDRG